MGCPRDPHLLPMRSKQDPMALISASNPDWQAGYSDAYDGHPRARRDEAYDQGYDTGLQDREQDKVWLDKEGSSNA